MNRDYFLTDSGEFDYTKEGIMAEVMEKYRCGLAFYEKDGALELWPCGAEEHGLYEVYVGGSKVDAIDYELLPAPTHVWILDIKLYSKDERLSKNCCTNLQEVFRILNEFNCADTVIQINRTESELIQGEMYNIRGIRIDTGELEYDGTLTLVKLN